MAIVFRSNATIVLCCVFCVLIDPARRFQDPVRSKSGCPQIKLPIAAFAGAPASPIHPFAPLINGESWVPLLRQCFLEPQWPAVPASSTHSATAVPTVQLPSSTQHLTPQTLDASCDYPSAASCSKVCEKNPEVSILDRENETVVYDRTWCLTIGSLLGFIN